MIPMTDFCVLFILEGIEWIFCSSTPFCFFFFFFLRIAYYNVVSDTFGRKISSQSKVESRD
ncbi:hypothetical protein I7I50_09848 [Histoplasma capsulatum G186AR]|uniref:Uncharacterized protein n=1 Tax=Ajellomyces capsulatus TaxID=5037 RepID=A0A8H8D598_AJECA|nr:hypothetical protein I7I52_10835 [Histoplasma capsulatum]QSS68768.1 hypothetical protein I7I50_09848 [Histoplasma capsulatum G186AR]